MIGAFSVGVDDGGKASIGRHRPGQNNVVRCFLVVVGGEEEGGEGGDDDGDVAVGEGGGVGNTSCVARMSASLDGTVAMVET